MEWLRPTPCDPVPDEVTADTLAIFMKGAKWKLPLDKIVVPITPKMLAKLMQREWAWEARDNNRRAAIPDDSECFTCSRSYTHADGFGRFCSVRCREAFDAGFMVCEETEPQYSLPTSGQGFAIACAYCKRTFSSHGLRCCSEECERKLRDAENASETLAGMERAYVHRKCEAPGCYCDIPRYVGEGKKRRKTPAGTRFCSRRCRDRAARDASSKPEKTPWSSARSARFTGTSKWVIRDRPSHFLA
jgi:hypothetical protein